MPNDFSRTERVQDLMQKALAVILQQEMKDPRITSMVTVTEVVVSKDLAYAKVYVTVLDDNQSEECLKVLNKASGFIRSQLSKRVQLRVLPALKFIYDDTTINANRISKLIDSVIQKDQGQISKDLDSQSE